MNLKIAVIPWNNAGMQNKIFIIDDPKQNKDNRNNPFFDMKKAFEDNGDVFQTVDLFEDLRDVDYFCFFELHWDWLYKIVKLGKADRMIYCNAEPPVFNAMNCPEGYVFISKFFPYILTWNDRWVDGKTIFSRNIPYYFVENFGNVPFEKRKLLTSISGNKKSDHPDELYSERERVISFFEKNYPDDFDFYGTSWDKEMHPNYKGMVANKAQTYHHYRYAVCFENMKNIHGYVTEKILDCFVAGIVPIYAGAEDIRNYVPENSFIDYNQFNTLTELAEYLLDIDKDKYEKYLQAAKEFMHSSGIDKFSGKKYADCIYDVIKMKKEFKVSFFRVGYIRFVDLKIKVTSSIKGKLIASKQKMKKKVGK